MSDFECSISDLDRHIGVLVNMRTSTKYKYSLKSSIATLLLMLLLLLMILGNVLKSGTLFSWLIFGIFALVITSLFVLLVIKRLIPAIKGDIAIELNDQVFIDYIRNITIDWADMKDIKLVRGRSASTLHIYLKWESDYGSQIAVPLRWVKGKDAEIYNTVIAYFRGQIVE